MVGSRRGGEFQVELGRIGKLLTGARRGCRTSSRRARARTCRERALRDSSTRAGCQSRRLSETTPDHAAATLEFSMVTTVSGHRNPRMSMSASCSCPGVSAARDRERSALLQNTSHQLAKPSEHSAKQKNSWLGDVDSAEVLADSNHNLVGWRGNQFPHNIRPLRAASPNLTL